MKKVMVIVFLSNLISSFSLLWAGGDLVNNGGSLAERNVLFAYNNLEFSLRLCIDSPTCRLSQKENKIIQDIYTHLDEERENQKQIVFISEKKAPGTFLIDGEMKAAVTGSEIGSVINVNTDLLYSKKNNNQLEALSIHEATAMLIHEFAHHHGRFSHTELDLLGLKVSQHLGKSTYQTPLLPSGSPISVVFINGEEGKSFPEVLLYSYQQMFNLSDLLKKEIACRIIGLPISIGPLPPIGIPIKRPTSFLVHNVYWEEIPQKSGGRFKIKGSLTSYCDSQKPELKINRNHKFEISFTMTMNHSYLNDLSKWSIDEKTIKIHQIREPWIRLLELGN
jgi:hypothetical protein